MIGSGLIGGVHSGFRTMKMPLQNGLKSGVVSNNIISRDKQQDFTILSGVKAETGCAWFADYGSYNSSYNLSGLVNQLPTGISFASNSDPNYNLGVNNNRWSLQFDSGDRVYTSSSTFLQGYTAQSVFLVCKLVGAGVLYSYVDSSSLDSQGDLLIEALDADTIQTSFYGEEISYPTKSYSRVKSTLPLGGNWFLVSVVADLRDNTGFGHKTFINGQMISNYTYNDFTPTTSVTFFGVNGSWGNNSSLASGGNNYIAGSLVLPYAVNSSERIRIENFFRNYYGFRF